MEPWRLSPTGAPRRPWKEENLTRLVPLLPSTTRLIVELSLQSGVALAEIVALRLDDVDAGQGRVRLRSRGRRRWLPIYPSLRGRLLDQHRQVTWVYRGDRLAGWGAPSGRGSPAGWLFPAQNPRVQPGGGRKLRVPVTEACIRETIWRVSLLAGGAPGTGGSEVPAASQRRVIGAPPSRRHRGPREAARERPRATGPIAAEGRGLAASRELDQASTRRVST